MVEEKNKVYRGARQGYHFVTSQKACFPEEDKDTMGKFSDTFMLEDPDGVNVEYSVKALNANLQSQCILPESFRTRCVLSMKLQLRR